MLARISRAAQRRVKFSSLPYHVGPLHVVEDDPKLEHMLAPRISEISAAVNQPPPPETPDVKLVGESDLLAYQRQYRREQETMETAVERFQLLSNRAAERGDIWTHRPATQLVSAWLNPVALGIRQAQELKWKVSETGGRKSLERETQALLRLLKPEVMAVILIHEAFGSCLRSADGMKVVDLAQRVANAVRAEVNSTNLRKLEAKQRAAEKNLAEAAAPNEEDGLLDSSGGMVSLPEGERKTVAKRRQSGLDRALKSRPSIVSAVNYAAMKAEVNDAVWSDVDQLRVGSKLLDILVKASHLPHSETGKPVPAFRYFKRHRSNKLTGIIELENATLQFLSKTLSKDAIHHADSKHQPMEVRPRPWISPYEGGYLKTKVSLIRYPPSHALDDALATADMQMLYDGINALGETAWMVNRGVLEVGSELWKRGGDIAGLVTRTDVTVPSKKDFVASEKDAFQARKASSNSNSDQPDEKFNERAAIYKWKLARKNAAKMNRELHSQRCDIQYRLAHAKEFSEMERFYLPHNVDFRGRAYPVPVYLQHMGSDLTRAMCTFAKPGIRLGERGVYWLKVHLANLIGADKKSYRERIEVAEDALSRAIAVGNDPMSESNLEWWTQHEDPFQLLAVCKEFSDAVGRNGNSASIEDYYSSLPVSMDGSCNGLQHYAALGRDVLGGKQVNLIDSERPQDVYTGVCNYVAKRIDIEAAKGNEIAKLLVGKISRKVVKQTVMTSVYGVTLLGAREQISNRLRDINFPEEQRFEASLLVAQFTLASLGDIFEGATKTMQWLSDSANMIAKSGHSVQWITPMGMPVIQPYRRKESKVVRTIMQRIKFEDSGEHIPVSPARQKSAFPPNFVHSIDSSHMLLTAISCEDAGLNFAAVHDSFWTNAATVDTMHEILREEFVKLHNRPLLTELRDHFRVRYPDVKLKELPERGELDLEQVLHSDYFFS